jgi:hypothetical protein
MLSGSIHDKVNVWDARYVRRGEDLWAGEVDVIRSVVTKPNKHKMVSSYGEQGVPDSFHIG